MELETKRLRIRDFVGEDWSEVHCYASDPEVTRYMIWGPNSEQETRDFIERAIRMQRQEPRIDYEFAVLHKETGDLIGGCGIHVSGAQAEIGYCFGREYWRQGYASEAAEAMLRFGFEELGLHRIYATCRPANAGSYKVMEKIGMKREGLLREHLWAKGAWHDSLLYAILAHEYGDSR